MLYMCVTSISIGFHMNGATRAKDNAKEICEVLSKQNLKFNVQFKNWSTFRRAAKN